MKIIVDASRCELHGECLVAAPEVFDIEDGHDIVTLLIAEPAESARPAVEEAALVCPVRAIRIED